MGSKGKTLMLLYLVTLKRYLNACIKYLVYALWVLDAPLEEREFLLYYYDQTNLQLNSYFL